MLERELSYWKLSIWTSLKYKGFSITLEGNLTQGKNILYLTG